MSQDKPFEYLEFTLQVKVYCINCNQFVGDQRFNGAIFDTDHIKYKSEQHIEESPQCNIDQDMNLSEGFSIQLKAFCEKCDEYIGNAWFNAFEENEVMRGNLHKGQVHISGGRHIEKSPKCNMEQK